MYEQLLQEHEKRINRLANSMSLDGGSSLDLGDGSNTLSRRQSLGYPSVNATAAMRPSTGFNQPGQSQSGALAPDPRIAIQVHLTSTV